MPIKLEFEIPLDAVSQTHQAKQTKQQECKLKSLDSQRFYINFLAKLHICGMAKESLESKSKILWIGQAEKEPCAKNHELSNQPAGE